jgi:hypothetical protein
LGVFDHLAKTRIVGGAASLGQQGDKAPLSGREGRGDPHDLSILGAYLGAGAWVI